MKTASDDRGKTCVRSHMPPPSPLRLCARLGRVWKATQVKLRGTYPPTRLLALKQYSATTLRWELLAVIMLTPLPSLALITLLEIVPLDPPYGGLQNNLSFFWRVCMTFFVLGAVITHQISAHVSVLPMTTTRIAVMSIFTAVTNTGIIYWLCSRVGFPLPFTIQVSAPIHLTLMSSCLAVSWHKCVRANSAVIVNIVQAFELFACQVWQIIIYPVYYFAFRSMNSDLARLAFLLVLPPLKVVNRNLFHLLSPVGDEFTPQIVVFNADVMSSLFVAFCMQYKPSIAIVASTTGIKLLQAVLSCRDIHVVVGKLTAVRIQICELRGLKNGAKTKIVANVLDEAADIITRFGINRQHATKKSISIKQVTPIDIFGGRAARRNNFLSTGPRIFQFGAPIQVAPFAQPADKERTKTPSNRAVRGASMLKTHAGVSDIERLERSYAALATKLLYMTEHMVLVEYVEVIIPAIYSLYLLVMFRMPNRVYYAQFTELDAGNLQRTVLNVLLYTASELVSLIVVHYGLKRELRLSAPHQLGFVLSRQAVPVQLSLILWVTYSTQSSLDHFGADYSFSFRWLGSPTSDNSTSH